MEQLKRAESFKDRKRAIVRQYDERLKDIDGLKLLKHNLKETSPFSYVVRVLDGQRDHLMDYLKELGIGTRVQFIPNHLQPVFSQYRISLPVTEKLYEEILTLPLYYEMTDDDVQMVIDGICSFYSVKSPK